MGVQLPRRPHPGRWIPSSRFTTVTQVRGAGAKGRRGRGGGRRPCGPGGLAARRRRRGRTRAAIAGRPVQSESLRGSHASHRSRAQHHETMSKSAAQEPQPGAATWSANTTRIEREAPRRLRSTGSRVENAPLRPLGRQYSHGSGVWCDIDAEPERNRDRAAAAGLTLLKGLSSYITTRTSPVCQGREHVPADRRRSTPLALILPARGGHSYVHARAGLAWH